MDWINFGWGPEFSKNFSPVENYHMDFKKATYSSRNIGDICIDAINRLCDKYPGPYTLMTSGGIDSQAMIWCWKQTTMPFDIVTVRYVDHDGKVLNSHDINNVVKISTLYDIQVQYIDFNLIQFLENNLLEYATTYQCTSPQITAHMCMSEMIHKGTVLFSGDFLATTVYSYTIYGLKRYADITKRNIIPFFLLHDSELTTILTREYKHLTQDEYMSLGNEKDFSSSRAYLKKVNAMKKIGIPVIPQAKKYSGFEKVKELYDTRYDLVSPKDRLKYAHMPSKRLFDIIFRYKLTEIIKYEDKIVCLP